MSRAHVGYEIFWRTLPCVLAHACEDICQAVPRSDTHFSRHPSHVADSDNHNQFSRLNDTILAGSDHSLSSLILCTSSVSYSMNQQEHHGNRLSELQASTRRR